MVWKVHTTSNYLSLYVYDILRVYNIHIYIYVFVVNVYGDCRNKKKHLKLAGAQRHANHRCRIPAKLLFLAGPITTRVGKLQRPHTNLTKAVLSRIWVSQK